MKFNFASILSLGSLLTVSAAFAQPSDIPEVTVIAHVPRTAAAHASADLIARTEKAIRYYAAGCGSSSEGPLSRAITADLRIEFPLRPSGMQLKADKTEGAKCSAISGLDGRIANLWIFPTREAGSVFVQYEVLEASESSPQPHLALLELSGERISRIVNFDSVTPVMSASLETRR